MPEQAPLASSVLLTMDMNMDMTLLVSTLQLLQQLPLSDIDIDIAVVVGLLKRSLCSSTVHANILELLLVVHAIFFVNMLY